MKSDQGMQVYIDPNEWYRFKKDLDKFDPALARALRRRIKNAGLVAAEAVKAKLAEGPTGSGVDSGLGREALIAATKVTVSFGKRSAGARIATGSSKLSKEHKGLLNVYNKTTFRHPLFGDKGTWFAQKGNPYFGAVIIRYLNRALVGEIRSALDEATRAIGAKGR